MALSLAAAVGSAPTPENADVPYASTTTYRLVNYLISLIYVLKSLPTQAIHLKIIFCMRVSNADSLLSNRERVVFSLHLVYFVHYLTYMFYPQPVVKPQY